MAEIANTASKATFKTLQFTAEHLAKLIDQIIKALDSNKRLSAQRKLYSFLKNGSGVKVNINDPYNMEAYKSLLQRSDIPFVQMDKGSLLIPQDYKDQAQKAYKDLLVLNCKKDIYNVPQKKLEELMSLNADLVKSKDIVTVHDLSVEEQELYKRKCNDTEVSNIIGINRDGEDTYSVSISAANNLCLEKVDDFTYRDDFCISTLQTAAALSSYTKDYSLNNAKADILADQNIFYYVDKENLAPDDTLYIVSLDDKSKYIRIDNDGFQVYKCSMEDGTLKVESDGDFVSSTVANYNELLEVECNKINNKELLINEKETVMNHLKTDDIVLDTVRDIPSPELSDKLAFNEHMCSEIDTLIKSKIVKEGITFDSPLEARNWYMDQASEILQGIETGKYDSLEDKYNIDVIEVLRMEASERNIDLKDIGSINSKLKEIKEKTEVHVANPDKVKEFKSTEKNKESSKEKGDR